MALNEGIWDPKLRGTNIKGTNLKSLIFGVALVLANYHLGPRSAAMEQGTQKQCMICASAAQETLRVQVPNNHILTQNLYYNSYCPNPKYLIIGYMDP